MSAVVVAGVVIIRLSLLFVAIAVTAMVIEHSAHLIDEQDIKQVQSVVLVDYGRAALDVTAGS